MGVCLEESCQGSGTLSRHIILQCLQGDEVCQSKGSTRPWASFSGGLLRVGRVGVHKPRNEGGIGEGRLLLPQSGASSNSSRISGFPLPNFVLLNQRMLRSHCAAVTTSPIAEVMETQFPPLCNAAWPWLCTSLPHWRSGGYRRCGHFLQKPRGAGCSELLRRPPNTSRTGNPQAWPPD